MPDATYAIRQKTEAAIRAYLAARVEAAEAATVLDDVEILLRQEITELRFPRVIVEALRSPEDETAAGLYMVELQVLCGTQATEGTTPATLHAQRTGLLAEWLADKASLLPALNPPTTGDDVRTVKGLYLYDIYLSVEEGEQTGEHWIDRLSYTVVAALRNE
jgi:hypothetical protein